MDVFPISVSLRVHAYTYLDGGVWIAICPALRVAAQGRTRRAAQVELRTLISANIDLYHERGVLDEVLREAALEPSSMLVPSKAQSSTLDVNMPINLLAARHAETRQAA